MKLPSSHSLKTKCYYRGRDRIIRNKLCIIWMSSAYELTSYPRLQNVSLKAGWKLQSSPGAPTKCQKRALGASPLSGHAENSGLPWWLLGVLVGGEAPKGRRH